MEILVTLTVNQQSGGRILLHNVKVVQVVLANAIHVYRRIIVRPVYLDTYFKPIKDAFKIAKQTIFMIKIRTDASLAIQVA